MRVRQPNTSAFSNFKDLSTYMKEQEEFERRKQEAALQQQLQQQQMNLSERKVDLEQQELEGKLAGDIGGGNTPAALRLANEYMKAKRDGNIEMANAIADFAKTKDKNIQLSQEGNYVPKTGVVDALRELEKGKQTGKEVAKTEYEPTRAEAVAKAKKIGDAIAEVEIELGEREAILPRLTEVTEELSSLSDDATYTMLGKARDFFKKEAGLGSTEGSIARKEYTSKVRNEILPLLKQTFGAQFTEREGEVLMETLGDPDATPEEKVAVLKSFIEEKKGRIRSLREKVKRLRGRSLQDQSISNNRTEEPKKTSNATHVYNPATGTVEAR